MRCNERDIEAVCKIVFNSIIIDVSTTDNDQIYTVEDWHQALLNPNIYILMPNEFTVITIFPLSGTIGHVHINVIPEGRGQLAIDAALDTVRWVGKNTYFTHVITHVPTKYMNVINFAKKVGFEEIITIPNSCVKNGKIYDTIELIRGL